MPCSKAMRGCRQGCLHKAFVDGYRDARIAWEVRLDELCIGYRGGEEEEAAREELARGGWHPPTLKAAMIANRQSREDHETKAEAA